MYYNLKVVRLFAAVLPIALVFVPSAAVAGYRDDLHITSVEIALLPQFCWMQFEVRDEGGRTFVRRVL